MVSHKNFWSKLSKPIIGMAPMDGVTDAPFRAVTDGIGHPTVLYTEFVSAEGFRRHPEKLKIRFASHSTTTPLVVQFFTAKPDELAKAIHALSDIPLSGIDINMGCPNNHVVHHGGGAGLIKTPAIAVKLIRAAKKAVDDMGKSWPVSIKTRIGYDAVVTNDWISLLLAEKPAVIALHGRTLKQMYLGSANWDEIALAGKLAHQTETLLLGNGDIRTHEDALTKAKTYSPDGVLIGRGALGNPWIFSGNIPTAEERIDTALLHCGWYEKFFGGAYVLPLRKHLAWYVKGFANAADMRSRLVHVQSIDEARTILKEIKTGLDTGSTSGMIISTS